MKRQDYHLIGHNQKMPLVPERKLFKTVKEDDVYPDGDATVYYARELTDLSFTKEIGAQELTTVDSDNYQHIYFDGYLHEGQIVLAEKIYGYWYVPYAERILVAKTTTEHAKDAVEDVDLNYEGLIEKLVSCRNRIKTVPEDRICYVIRLPEQNEFEMIAADPCS